MSEFIRSVNGYTIKDPNAKHYPRLTDAQKTNLSTLWGSYYNNRSSFYYDFTNKITDYATPEKAHNENGKTPICCSSFVQLVWGGVSPSTFVGKQGEYSGEIVQSFSWGYGFRFLNRKAVGITATDGKPYGLIKPNDDSYIDSYSANSYYSEGSDRTDKQVFVQYMYASDLACELYNMGCEVPMSELDKGDIVFFRSPSIVDGQTDQSERKAFRNITHVALVYDASCVKDGYYKMIECSNWETSPIIYTAINSNEPATIVRAADLANRACMVARHPAAFGISNPIGEYFTIE